MCTWGLNSEILRRAVTLSAIFVFQLGSLHKDACQGCEEAPSCCATFCLQVPGKERIQEVAMENWFHSLVAP